MDGIKGLLWEEGVDESPLNFPPELPSPLCDSVSDLTDEELVEKRYENLRVMEDLVGGIQCDSWILVRIWKGYEFSLLKYQHAMCTEWHIVRGYDDENIFRRTSDMFWDCKFIDFEQEEPWWFAEKTSP